jgi:hypothetical protein
MLGMRHEEGLFLKFDVGTLKEKVRKNREQHRSDYEEAKKKYRERLVRITGDMHAAAKRGEKVRHHIDLAVPVHYTSHYDRALQMLEQTTDKTVELSATIFAQLVQDEWDWKKTFSACTLSYGVGKAPSGDGDDQYPPEEGFMSGV